MVPRWSSRTDSSKIWDPHKSIIQKAKRPRVSPAENTINEVQSGVLPEAAVVGATVQATVEASFMSKFVKFFGRVKGAKVEGEDRAVSGLCTEDLVRKPGSNGLPTKGHGNKNISHSGMRRLTNTHDPKLNPLQSGPKWWFSNGQLSPRSEKNFKL